MFWGAMPQGCVWYSRTCGAKPVLLLICFQSKSECCHEVSGIQVLLLNFRL